MISNINTDLQCEMNNSIIVTEELSDFISIGSGVYLVLVFIAGAICNIKALLYAVRVGKVFKGAKCNSDTSQIILRQITISKLCISLQAKQSKFNLILINLLVSDLAMLCICIPLESSAAFSKGESMNNILCPITAFINTILGKYRIYIAQVIHGLKSGYQVMILFYIFI